MVKAKRKRVSKVVPSRKPANNRNLTWGKVKVNPADYYDPERKGFKIGNPGRAVGTENFRTKFQRMVLECFDEPVQKRLHGMLLKSSPRFFLQTFDRVATVYGSGGRVSDNASSEMPPFVLHIEGHGVVNETKTKPGESIP